MIELNLSHYAYFLIVVLMAIGLYAMLAKRNLLKKIVGMNILQTAIYIFFIQGATKSGATVPVIDESIGAHASQYINPLPHVLILTSIVVGISVTGVALAFLISMYRNFGTLEDDTIMSRLKDMPD